MASSISPVPHTNCCQLQDCSPQSKTNFFSWNTATRLACSRRCTSQWELHRKGGTTPNDLRSSTTHATSNGRVPPTRAAGRRRCGATSPLASRWDELSHLSSLGQSAHGNETLTMSIRPLKRDTDIFTAHAPDADRGRTDLFGGELAWARVAGVGRQQRLREEGGRRLRRRRRRERQRHRGRRPHRKLRHLGSLLFRLL